MRIEDFTLFVPVRNRHYNLPKIVSFYKNLKSDKIIADSSEFEYSDVETLKESGFKYIHYPNLHPFDKFRDVAEQIDTKYMLDCSDDDFYTFEGIEESVNFLSNNDDFSLCDGIYIESCNLRINRLKYSGSLFHDNRLFFDEDIKTRLSSIFNFKNYYPRVHSVIRTDVFKRIYDFFYGEKKKRGKFPISFTDRFFTLIASISGKFKVLNTLYGIRKGGGDRLLKDKNISKEWDLIPRSKRSYNKENLENLCKILQNNYGSMSFQESFDFIKNILLKCNGINRYSNINLNKYLLKHKKEIKEINKIMWSE